MPPDKLSITFLQRGNDPYTDERIRYLKSKGHLIHSISFYYVNPDKRIEGVKYVQMRKLIIDKIPLIKRFSHYFELKEILNSIKPDVFHVVSALNLIYLNYNLPFKKIIENQGSDLILTPRKNKFLVPFYRKYYLNADGVIQDSQVLYQKSIHFGATEKNGFNQVFEIGIDFTIFNPHVTKNIVRAKYGLDKNPIILHTRGKDPLYNLDIILNSLIKVISIIPNVILILTTFFENLSLKNQRIIKKHDLFKNIVFAGFQNRLLDLKYFYADADIVLSVPSSDSSPFTVYESMACLTPVIVTDLQWLYSKFIPGKHLYTVPARDIQKLADVLINCLLKKECNVDVKSAYQVVFEKVNMMVENNKLENYYYKILDF